MVKHTLIFFVHVNSIRYLILVFVQYQRVPINSYTHQRGSLAVNTIIPNVISDICMGQGPSSPHTKFQQIIIWLFWFMVMAVTIQLVS